MTLDEFMGVLIICTAVEWIAIVMLGVRLRIVAHVVDAAASAGVSAASNARKSAAAMGRAHEEIATLKERLAAIENVDLLRGRIAAPCEHDWRLKIADRMGDSIFQCEKCQRERHVGETPAWGDGS
jgi:hypothetical protein